MNVQTDFPQLLRDYRQKNGLSRRELASRIGVTYDSIVGYELGRHLPSPLTRNKIIQEMGCEPETIPQGKRGAWFEKSPLTDEEQKFAAQNHDILINFLKYRGFELDEWYDVAAFGYLHAVKLWFLRSYLHKYKFQIIAVNNIRSVISREYRSQRARPKEVSIYDNIPGTEIPYAEMLCDPRDNIVTDF